MSVIQLPEEIKNKKVILCKEDPFFLSPQGEGIFMGRLSAWVRTSSCNLRCSWLNPNGEVTLCDTAYTSHKPERNMTTLQEIYDSIMNNKAPHVVITGGEPTIQKPLMNLIKYIEESGKRVTVETNGTNFVETDATLISMSPKLISSSSGLLHWSNSENIQQDTDNFLWKLHFPEAKKRSDLTNEQLENLANIYKKNYEFHQKNRYNLESMKSIMEYYGPSRYQFKFVVNNEEDIKEIWDDYIHPLNIPIDNVWLMPQGISAKQLNSRAEWVVDKCKLYGFNYSDRIHIRIWGNRTGV